MSKASPLQNVSIILVRPEFLGNIGSTCRVMKNFGIHHLRIVEAPKNYRDAEARMMAVGAFDVLKSACLFDSLAEAVADTHLAVALSSGRRRSRRLDNFSKTLPELIGKSQANRLAFVFGHERNGLLDEEIALCNEKVRIETSNSFPSLNLAQAVGIVCYSLASAIEPYESQPSEKPVLTELPTNQETVELFDQLGALIDNTEFSRPHNREKVLGELRDAYERMTPTQREAALIKGVIRKLNKRLAQK